MRLSALISQEIRYGKLANDIGNQLVSISRWYKVANLRHIIWYINCNRTLVSTKKKLKMTFDENNHFNFHYFNHYFHDYIGGDYNFNSHHQPTSHEAPS